MSRMSRLPQRLAPLVLGLTMLVGCGPSDEGTSEDRDALDTRLQTHAVLPGTPTADGLAYIQAIVDAHADADATDPERATAILLTALERDVPAGDGTLEILHLELAARASELLLDQGRAEQTLDLLEPLLATDRSLPLDRASARALVLLGDAAAKHGDHALAMSSYARALEVLSLLLEEVES